MDTKPSLRKCSGLNLLSVTLPSSTKSGHVLASKQRKGVDFYTSEEVERNFVSIIPPIIVDAVEELEK
jgi:hypothetical protein